MVFALTLLYVLLLYITPAHISVALIPFRVQIVVVVLASLTALLVMITERDAKPPVLQSALLGCLMAAMAVSQVLAQRWLGGIPVVWLDFLPSLMAFFLVTITAKSYTKMRILQLCIVAVALYITVIGTITFQSAEGETPFVLQYALFGQSGEVIGEIRRLKFLGLLEDPNDLGQFLLIAMIFLWGSWKRRNAFWNLLVIGVPTAFLVYGIYLTKSRGTLVGLALVLFVLVRSKLNAFVGAVLSGVALLGLLASNFTGGRDISLEEGSDRLDLWSEGLAMIKTSPLWGIGYKSYADEVGQTAHNSYLVVAAELGLPAYLCFIALIVTAIQTLRMLSNAPSTAAAKSSTIFSAQDPGHRQAHILLLAMTAYLSTAWFLSRAYQPMPYILLGSVSVVASLEFEKGRREVEQADRIWPLRTVVVSVGVLMALYLAVRMGRIF